MNGSRRSSWHKRSRRRELVAPSVGEAWRDRTNRSVSLLGEIAETACILPLSVAVVSGEYAARSFDVYSRNSATSRFLGALGFGAPTRSSCSCRHARSTREVSRDAGFVLCAGSHCPGDCGVAYARLKRTGVKVNTAKRCATYIAINAVFSCTWDMVES